MLTEAQKGVSRSWPVVLFCLMLLLANGACTDRQPVVVLDLNGVDPLFSRFYNHLGGEESLGKVISNIMMEGAARAQYTENVKMVWNPQSPIENRFSLAPLGVQMGYVEPAISPMLLPDYHYVDGHAVPSPFYDKFEVLGGKNLVGSPLTEVLYDSVRGRFYQYFERAGFYRLRNSSKVYLLSYGLMMCDKSCRKSEFRDAGYDLLPEKIHPAFQAEVQRLGIDFTGFAVSPAYLTPGGRLRQVMANVVLETCSPGQPGRVRLYPIVKEIGIPVEYPRLNQQGEGMCFLATDGALGFETPQYFWEYLREHGGVQISGPPVTHLAVDGKGYRQCFTNLCLSFQPGRPRQVVLEPLGRIYATLNLSSLENLTPAPMVQSFITVKAWDAAQVVSSSQQQEIGALVWEDDVPLTNVTLVLELTLPDDGRQEQLMPPTGADGKTALRLPPIQAANGSLVFYRVCYLQPALPSYCTPQESFVIWGNP